MTRREAWLSAGLVFVVAALVRAWAATQITFPQPEDTAYYVDVARNLLAGRGLTTDAIWSFATPPLTFNPPRPAFEIWLPLATILDAIPMAVAGATFAAAQVTSIVVGSLVAVLAWRLGADVAEDLDLPRSRARTLAIGSGLTAGVYLPLVLFSVQPDSTMLFAAVVLVAILVIRRILRSLAVVAPPPPRPRFKLSRRQARRQAASQAHGHGQSQTASQAHGHGQSQAASQASAQGQGPGHDGDSYRNEAPSARSLAGVTLATFGVALPNPWLLVGLGAVIGVAALTRNDAAYLAVAWAIVGWRATRPAATATRRLRATLAIIGIPAIVAIACYAPWAIRDWFAFGTLLPGQALSNALFLDGHDVFAWADPPTLSRYLDAGFGTLLGLRVTGFLNNLGSVLLLLGVPISAVGLLALPSTGRIPTLRPLTGFALVTFLVATLVFPVATTWGTFLHAAGAIHVLVIISALVALDRLVERVRTSRQWTRPVAWLGAAAAMATSLVLTAALVPSTGAAGRATEALYQALPNALAAAGAPLPTDGSPVITDFPIWLATEDHVHAIALPNEQPSDVLQLADTFGAKLLIVSLSDSGQWPEILDQTDAPDTQCFQLVTLPGATDPSSPLNDVAAYQITCASAPQGLVTP